MPQGVYFGRSMTLPSLRGASKTEVDQLARDSGFSVRSGTKANPSTTYYRPGRNESEGFRVVDGVPQGSDPLKRGPYLRRFGSPVDEPTRIPLAGES